MYDIMVIIVGNRLEQGCVSLNANILVKSINLSVDLLSIRKEQGVI